MSCSSRLIEKSQTERQNPVCVQLFYAPALLPPPIHSNESALTMSKARSIVSEIFRLGRIPIQEKNSMRRRFLSQLLSLPFLALGTKAQESKKTLRILMRSSWGTDDPTRASFVFAHALALADAGHEVQIFLTADANYLMHKATSDAVIPIGWPPLSELREKVVAKHFPVFA